MIEILACTIALASIALSAFMLLQVQSLTRRLGAAERALTKQAPALAEPTPIRLLAGLRVDIAITQDHTHPVFANLLKETLLSEDVANVTMLDPREIAGWKARDDGADFLISGEIVCNGYAEVFYTADLVCSTHRELICTLVEKPPHGDRPTNLAIELVDRIKTELEKMLDRNERRRAIRELRGLPESGID